MPEWPSESQKLENVEISWKILDDNASRRDGHRSTQHWCSGHVLWWPQLPV